MPPTRTDTAALEPRYLEMLEAERGRWWSSANFDSWKRLYTSEYARGHEIIELLARYLPAFRVRGAQVLDIGCGDAGVAIAFAEAGALVSGVEVDLRGLARGRVRAHEHGVSARLLAAAAEALPFPTASFDLVVLDNVLEHVRDRRATLAEIRRLLRPGGVLYLVTPKPFTPHAIWSDPHYGLTGLVLLPRALQRWYFERVRRGGAGSYNVGAIPTRRGVRRLLRDAGFALEVEPRELWIHYLRRRIAEPAEVRPGLKRRLAAWLSGREWPFSHPLPRLLWDVALGSNLFLARREP
jgi:SAM-dependent methyltransferase